MELSRFWRVASLVFLACIFVTWLPAHAISTGNISGTVTNDSGAPVADAAVSATSPAAKYTGKTDAHGFYTILNMAPDTYTVTFSGKGYEATVVAGVTVFQDQTLVVDAKLHPQVATLGRVSVTATSTNLVQPNVTSNTYNITTAQQNTILGDSTHHTLYDVLWRTPGITSGPTSNSPIIRGGTTTEVGWEFEEIPIVDRTVGFYTTELSTTGIGNVEVTTGGLSADQGGSNGGIINMVVKQGTYPPKGDVTFGVGGPAYAHSLDMEYGTATPDNRWSVFFAGSYTNTDQRIGNSPSTFYYENVEGFDFVNTKDTIGNIHYRWGDNNQNDLQYIGESGVGIFRPSYGGNQGTQLAMVGEDPKNTTAAGCSVASPCVAALLALKLNADSWYHWYNIQKLSYSRTINDRSYYRLRVAQSNNGYFFDEEWAQNVGEPCLFGGSCIFGQGWFNSGFMWCYGCYYQDRHTLQTFYNGDYSAQLGEHNLIKVGAGYEYDKNFRKVADCCPPFEQFDALGNYLGWPFYDRVTLAPTEIWGAYLSDHVSFDKWVVEPGVRYDLEHYSISPVVAPNGVEVPGSAHPFSETFVSPRIALTYTAGASDVFRASYEHLGQFIGTAYAENFGAGIYPLYGGAHFSPQRPATAKSYDFSWEHQFPHHLSLRVTPYAHNNDDYVVEYAIFHGPTVFTNGGSTHTRGVELGLSREMPEGLSTFLSFTYNDTKSNVLSFAGPYFGGFGSTGVAANIQAKNYLPATYSAPWTGNLALDWKHAGWEINTNTLWTTAYPYGIGRQIYVLNAAGQPVIQPNPSACTVTTNAGQVCLDNSEATNAFPQSLRSGAWYQMNFYLSHSVGTGRVGVSVLNVTNNILNPIPATNFKYLNTTGGAWTPLPECPPQSQFTANFGCYDAIYPAPNAYTYPTTGYFRQQNLTPREVTFWYKVNI